MSTRFIHGEGAGFELLGRSSNQKKVCSSMDMSTELALWLLGCVVLVWVAHTHYSVITPLTE